MKRLFNEYNRKIWIVFGISLLIGAVVFPFLPDRVPIHFDITGTPDNYGNRWSIFLGPGVIFILTILAEFFKKYDPKSSSYETFKPQYYNIHFAVALLMVGVQLLTIAFVFGMEVNLSRIIPAVVGLLFIFLGNMMPKFKHNYFVGIRTSWTLASERVWYLTHRFAGKVWVISGIASLFITLLPLELLWWLFLVVAAVMVFLPLAASFYYYKKYGKEK